VDAAQDGRSVRGEAPSGAVMAVAMSASRRSSRAPSVWMVELGVHLAPEHLDRAPSSGAALSSGN
jgi:hypothetical protein